MQKAISYSMTSVFTTGGIRGSKKRFQSFSPEVLIWALKSQYLKK